MDGFLNVHKPTGVTSRDVVDRVERLVRPARAGHAGTLDPLATGVLVVAIGGATRLIEYVQRQTKAYVGTFLLGRESTTEDVTGEVTELVDPPMPTRAAIEQVVPQFIGPIEQMPPAFSALKIEGRRAYRLARSGQKVELAPRKITIHTLEVLEYDYPRLVLSLTCGAGTYVRSLGRDLARALDTGAAMSALVRTAVGAFRLEEAVPMAELTSDSIAARLVGRGEAARSLPRIELTPEQVRDCIHGKRFSVPAAAGLPVGVELAGFGPSGTLAAIIAVVEGEIVRPHKVFPEGPA